MLRVPSYMFTVAFLLFLATAVAYNNAGHSLPNLNKPIIRIYENTNKPATLDSTHDPKNLKCCSKFVD